MIGQMVGHYRIEEKLGQGGMGLVYRAEDTRLGRRAALKALTPECARDPQRRKRFQQEARAAATLSHPGIAAVYALEEVGEDLYLVFEYVRGENLRAAIRRRELQLDAILEIAAAIARALAAAHEHGIVHRDLKPENIIRTPQGAPKISTSAWPASNLPWGTAQPLPPACVMNPVPDTGPLPHGQRRGPIHGHPGLDGSGHLSHS